MNITLDVLTLFRLPFSAELDRFRFEKYNRTLIVLMCAKIRKVLMVNTLKHFAGQQLLQRGQIVCHSFSQLITKLIVGLGLNKVDMVEY